MGGGKQNKYSWEGTELKERERAKEQKSNFISSHVRNQITYSHYIPRGLGREPEFQNNTGMNEMGEPPWRMYYGMPSS